METKYIAVNSELLQKCLSQFEAAKEGKIISVPELIYQLTEVLSETYHYQNQEYAKAILESFGIFGSHWSMVDIIYTANKEGYDITEEQAKDIAQRIEKYHDASVGINWEVIEYHVGDYCEGKGIAQGDPIENDLFD